MKKLYFSAILFLFCLSGYAQDILSVNFSQNYARFKFVSSEGQKDKDIITDIKSCYGFSYAKIFNSGFMVRPELGYKNNGATSVTDIGNKIQWNLHYLDFNVGLGYRYIRTKLQPYGGISLYSSYMFKADQTIGTTYYNLYKYGNLKKGDFGIIPFLGVGYKFSDLITLSLEYRNSTGLVQLEKGSGQKLFNRTNSIQFGLGFYIINVKKEE